MAQTKIVTGALSFSLVRQNFNFSDEYFFSTVKCDLHQIRANLTRNNKFLATLLHWSSPRFSFYFYLQIIDLKTYGETPPSFNPVGFYFWQLCGLVGIFVFPATIMFMFVDFYDWVPSLVHLDWFCFHYPQLLHYILFVCQWFYWSFAAAFWRGKKWPGITGEDDRQAGLM